MKTSSPPSPRALALALASALVAPACGDGGGDELSCRSDEECRTGERCLPSGVCEFGVECLDDAECEATDPRTVCDLDDYTCVFREGFGDECGPGRPCPFGQFCTELLGLCLDASSARDCVRRSQCPANQICDRDANKCVPDPGCFSDAFCEPGEVCDTVNRTCGSAAPVCSSCAIEGCPEGQACNGDTRECLAPAEEAVCRQGETCDPLGRCVQCSSDDDCGPGTFCNASIGRCESNIQCADDPSQCPRSEQVQCVVCQKPEVCNSRTKRCEAPPEPCDSDLDCPNDQICDFALEPPICVPRLPDCINDLFDEPRNDGPARARTLDPMDGPVFAELKLCPGDQDWYRLEVPAGTFLTVDARFEHDEGDLELQLYLDDGITLVDQSRSTTDNERVELEVGTDLTLLVRAFLGTQTVRPLDYRLVVSAAPGEVCPDDEAEPNDGPASAAPLAFGRPFDGRLCPADPDWFALRMVPEGAAVDLDLDFVDSLGNLDLQVFRGGANTPLLEARSLDDGERLSFDAPFGGDFFVRVVGAAADGNVYRLRATLRPGEGGQCRDDPLEPNESPLAPTAAGALLGQPQELTLCRGDEDWFEVDVDAFELLEASIGFDGTRDLDLALYPPGTTDREISPLRLSAGLNPREYIAFRPLQSGRYLVRVYGARASDVSEYTLRLGVRDPNRCMPDDNDQAMLGDSQADPVNLGFPPASRRASLCRGDVDWYQLFAEGGFRTTIRLEYPTDVATLDYELLTFDGTSLGTTQGQGLTNLREFNVNVPGNGVALLLVRVFSANGSSSEYELSATTVPVFACNPDIAEPNGSVETASTLTATTASPIALEATLCPSTRDPLSGVGD